MIGFFKQFYVLFSGKHLEIRKEYELVFWKRQYFDLNKFSLLGFLKTILALVLGLCKADGK